MVVIVDIIVYDKKLRLYKQKKKPQLTFIQFEVRIYSMKIIMKYFDSSHE